MSKVYFLGAGATKAVAPHAPLNNEILDIALSEADLGLGEIKEERDEIRKFINTVFHDNRNTNPRLEDVLSFIDFNLRERSTKLSGYNYALLSKIT